MFRAVISVGLIALLVPAMALGQQPVRKGFTLGFDLGGGGGKAEYDFIDDDEFESGEGGGAFSLRIGYAPNQKLVLAYDSAAFSFEKEPSTRTTLAVGGFGATWYPSGGGGFIKGVLGFSRVEVEIQFDDLDVSGDGGGFGTLIGGGYEFRLSRSFALVPAAQLAFAQFDDANANWFAIMLGFHWYPTTPAVEAGG